MTMSGGTKFAESIWGTRGQKRKSTVPEYYVYVLLRHNGQAIYVGKGKGSRWERDFTKEGENSRLAAIIRQDLAAGLPATTLAIAKKDMLESEAFQLEANLIAMHGRIVNGGTLTNMTNGAPAARQEWRPPGWSGISCGS